jgi:hypothetical protein
LKVEINQDQVFQASEGAGGGAGRSGSFFFFSYDHRFIIKTLQTDELKVLSKNMVAYK